MNIKAGKFFGGILILAVPILANHLFGFLTTEKYMVVLARYFSTDGVIVCNSCVLNKIDQPFIFLLLAWTIISIAIQKFNRQDFDLFHFHRVPFDLQVAWIFFFALTISWFVFKYLNLHPEYYKEDYFFENMTAVLLFFSSLLIVIRFFHREQYSQAGLILIALGFFVIGMEEISWGQRIIGWQTPDTFSIYNYQNETNLHNAINPIMTPLYILGNLFLGCMFLFIEELHSSLSRSTLTKPITVFLPTLEYKSLGYIFLFLALHRFWFGDELTEETFSVIGLAYALFVNLKAHHIQPVPLVKRLVHHH